MSKENLLPKESIWYEEDLLPPEASADDTITMLKQVDVTKLAQEKALNESTLAQEKAITIDLFARKKAKGILIVYEPRVRWVKQDEARQLPNSQGGLLESGKLAQGTLFLIRLGMELNVESEKHKLDWGYQKAWFRTSLYAPDSNVQPRVLDIYPQRIYAGGSQIVQVKAEPSLKITSMVEASLGSISTDLQVGLVTPVTLGFFGEEERKPYWELQEKEKPIRGAYHFWALVDQSTGCGDIYLEILGEGNLCTTLLTIPVGPTVREWRRRKRVNLMDLVK